MGPDFNSQVCKRGSKEFRSTALQLKKGEGIGVDRVRTSQLTFSREYRIIDT